MDSNIFLQLSALLAITVSVGFFVRSAKQPLLIAYIIAGIIGGPLLLNILPNNEHTYSAFANVGVVLLLFIIGLDLNFAYLKKIGKETMIIAGWQILFNFLLILPIARFFGFAWGGAIFLTVAACFSSTIVILKILGDKQDEETVYGRYTIGLLLVQDLISIFILLYLSFNNQGGGISVFPFLSLVKLFLVVGSVVFITKYILPKLLQRIANSGEFLFIFTIAWCFGISSLMLWSGFSLEIGAIIAGLALGSSRYQAEIASRVKPLRDFFIVIFFMVLGSESNLQQVDKVLLPAVILAVFVLIVKPLVLYILFRFRHFTRRNSFLAALTSGQLSEFGFIILFAGSASGYLTGDELGIFTIAALITIFFSSYVITYSYKIYNLFSPILSIFGKDKYAQKEDVKENFEAFIFGYHRTGWKIGEALKDKKIKFAAVDFNPDNNTLFNISGVKAFFGDASDVEFLKTLPLKSAKIIISTIPSPEDQMVLIHFIRRHNPNAIMIATLYHKKYIKSLYKAGADYVILPHLLGGSWTAEIILRGELKKRSAWKKYREQQNEDIENK